MTEDEFWRIISEAKEGAGIDMQAKERLLKKRLESADADATLAFDDHMHNKIAAAYTWPLWAAAYIIHGGCSDDAFMDFRSSLVCMGRQIFEAACRKPDSLAVLDDDTLYSLFHEGLLYVAGDVYEAKVGERPTGPQGNLDDPLGDSWDEDDDNQLMALCPELWKRFGD